MTHRHRWLLDRPDGPVIHGVCKCGERRTWPASPQHHGVYALKRRIGTDNSRRKAT